MDAAAVRRDPGAARAVLDFWFAEARRKKWFRGGPHFDADIRRRFSAHHAAASTGRLDPWRATPAGALALILILDQFSRNIFRRDARAFAQDARCRDIAGEAIARRFDKIAPDEAKAFFYLPFMHSEDLRDQRRSVALFKAQLPASGNLAYAIEHAAIVARFGRFPHRNEALGRSSTPEEIAFLKQGGFRA